MRGASRAWGTGALATATGVVLLFTLFPLPFQNARTPGIPSACVLCGEVGTADFLLNILLLVPWGVGARWAGLAFGHSVAGALALSALVESAQWVGIPGRDPALGDLIANTLGACLGYVLGKHGNSLIAPRPARARWLALGWGCGLLATFTMAGWALRPALPDGPWFGQWSGPRPEPGWIDGTVQSAHLGSLPLMRGLLRDTPDRRAALLGSPLRLSAVVSLAGQEGLGPRWVVAVGSSTDRFLYLGLEGQDLLFRAPMRAATLRLRTPTFRLPNAFPLGPEAPLRISGTLAAADVTLRAEVVGHDHEGSIALGPWDGWMLLVPWKVTAGAAVAWARLGWLLGWILPLAWWVRRGLWPGPSP